MAADQAGKKVVRLLPLPTIKDVMQLYKVRAVRALSQNFLIRESMTHRIVKNAGSVKDCEVCEVGPGPGNITRCIIHKKPEKVIVIEKDKQFLPTLQVNVSQYHCTFYFIFLNIRNVQLLKDASPIPLEIIQGDVLRFNMENIFSENKRKKWEDDFPNIHIIGNLPFSVATPLIVRWIRDISEK